MREMWDGSLIHRLDEIRIDASRPLATTVNEVVLQLRRFGFALLRGLARDNADAPQKLCSLGGALGRIVAQSPRGELLEDVRDFSDVEARDDRGYRSRGELAPHSDPSTVIGLHCLQPAKSGGETSIVNVDAIYARLQADSPDLAACLFSDFPVWEVAGQHGIAEARPAASGRPVLAMRDGVLSCVIYRPFIERAAAAAGAPLDARQVAALDAFERASKAPDLTLRFHLRRGDTMLLNNRAVLHARTDYEDWPEPDRRRHLLRVWVDAPRILPVAQTHALGDLFAEPLAS